MLDEVFAKLRYELVPAPRMGKNEVSDVKDQPILNAAVTYDIDIIITGDHHFLLVILIICCDKSNYIAEKMRFQGVFALKAHFFVSRNP